MPDSVALCSASNQTYVQGVAAALASAVLNAPCGAHCRVYLLDGGIRDGSWRKLERTLAALGRSCELIRLRPNMESFAGLPQDWGASVMTYARLALPQMVKEERILYVDADMVVQADWTALWEMELGEDLIAAAPDVITKTLSGDRLDLAKFQLDGAAPYFQAGFLLMDLKRWRESGVSEKVLTYLRENPEHCRFWDQSALNVVLYGRWKRLPDEWNTPAWWADDSSKPGYALDAPVLHFVGPNKPWNYGHHGNPSSKVFFAWLDRTAWKGWRPNGWRFALKMVKYRAGQWLSALRRS
jgi:lipopolysaccharide biosynthesis glycosyltransferase